MAYLTWIADALRADGLPVREVPGWKTRGHGSMHPDILGVIAHHTGGAAAGVGQIGDLIIPGYPSLDVVVNGRPGLAGPLANLGLARDGAWITIAAGQAWHAGTGSAPWCPANQGNSHCIGVEAESVGTRDDWTDAQRGSYPRGVAALLRYLGLPAVRLIAHREWAPARKIDPAFWDMNSFRRDVDRWIRAAAQPPQPTPAPPDPYIEDDDMYIKCESVKGGPIWTGLLSGGLLVGPMSAGEANSADNNIIKNGALVQWVERATWDRLAART